jgi:hypothetical protein
MSNPARKPRPQHGQPAAEVLVPHTSRDGRWAGGCGTPDSTACTWGLLKRPNEGKKASQWPVLLRR